MVDSSTNQTQIEFWNGPAAARWVTEQERLDRVLRAFDDLGQERAAARSGERVVDVGCGCGASTVRLAECVGANGHVLGVDVSERMLARARERTARFPWVELRLGDASEARFAADADLLYSRFGSMFFADPRAAFANLRTALRPGGRLCLVCWRAIEDNPWYLVPLRAAESIVAPLPHFEPGAPGPFAFADRDRLSQVLAQAGFRDVTIERHDVALALSTSGLDEAVEYAVLAGPVARMTVDADASTVARVRSAIRDVLAPYARAERVELTSSVWLATARA
jgi:ubiquinone/menaquinone biosynthesis C-methylase UbiE